MVVLVVQLVVLVVELVVLVVVLVVLVVELLVVVVELVVAVVELVVVVVELVVVVVVKLVAVSGAPSTHQRGEERGEEMCVYSLSQGLNFDLSKQDSNPEPLDPKAEHLPLDHDATQDITIKLFGFTIHCVLKTQQLLFESDEGVTRDRSGKIQFMSYFLS
ncbi:hypothetical protein ElyMa_003631300 [Elysia marginata]|uniref:Uncharacterized protein n=1 Tax=Elysia marginata TaxID=1093978 RepID=A0AAV4EUU8_9GAST|nr:hypothetical protein ElyMa_003631300 [Elysia marginata]